MLNENTKVVGWWVMVEIDMDKLFQIFSFKIVQAGKLSSHAAQNKKHIRLNGRCHQKLVLLQLLVR